jgi:hypothetical protein
MPQRIFVCFRVAPSIYATQYLVRLQSGALLDSRMLCEAISSFQGMSELIRPVNQEHPVITGYVNAS